MKIIVNKPKNWKSALPKYKSWQNKYDHGHVLVIGGDKESTGAAKLVALSALRAGAGLVTIASPSNAQSIYAASLTSVMSKTIDDVDIFLEFMATRKVNAVATGSGSGLNDRTFDFTLAAIRSGRKVIIDADAITIFAQQEYTKQFLSIVAEYGENIIFTPHLGEFKRLFDYDDSHVERSVLNAAKTTKAVILLKGHNTVIASPNGEVVVNKNAPPYLAKAGSGDVLAGIITGLVANNMKTFDAACAGVWIHSEAATRLSVGMIAEDLIGKIPEVLGGVSK